MFQSCRGWPACWDWAQPGRYSPSAKVSLEYKGGALGGMDTDHPALASAIAKFHNSVNLGEERVVPSAPNVEAWEEPRSALPDQDAPARDELPGESLDTQSLGMRVASVS